MSEFVVDEPIEGGSMSNVLQVLGLDCKSIPTVITLFQTSDYKLTLGKMLEDEDYRFFNEEEWELIASINQLIVVWRPETANEWLNMIVDYVCSNKYITLGFYQGTILGLLEAGVWIEDNLHNKDIKFLSDLFMGIAKIICHCDPAELPNLSRRQNIDYASLQNRILKAIEAFLFPSSYSSFEPKIEKELKEIRLKKVREGLVYVRDNIKKQKLEFGSNLILTHIVDLLFRKMTVKDQILALASVS